MQIEVDQAVQQQPADRRDRSGVNGAREMALFCREAASRFAKQDPEKCESTQRTRNSRFGEHFDVVVVHVIDNLAVVVRFVAGIHRDKRAKSRASNGMVEKHVGGTANHRRAAGKRDVPRTQA